MCQMREKSVTLRRLKSVCFFHPDVTLAVHKKLKSGGGGWGVKTKLRTLVLTES